MVEAAALPEDLQHHHHQHSASRKASLPNAGNPPAPPAQVFGRKKSWAEHLADEEAIHGTAGSVAMSAIVPPAATAKLPLRQAPTAYYHDPSYQPYLHLLHQQQQQHHQQFGKYGNQLALPGADRPTSAANGALGNPVKFVNSTVEILQNQMKREEAPKKKRTRTTPEQLRILQRAFAADPMPNSSTRLQLAKRLGMNGRAVQVWFQNRRAKAKRQDSLPSGMMHHGLSAAVDTADEEHDCLEDGEEEEDGDEELEASSPAATAGGGGGYPELLRSFRPKQQAAQRHSLGGGQSAHLGGKAPLRRASTATTMTTTTTTAASQFMLLPPAFYHPVVGGSQMGDDYDAVNAFLAANQLHAMPGQPQAHGEADLFYGGGLLANHDAAAAAHFATADLHPSLLMMGMDFHHHHQQQQQHNQQHLQLDSKEGDFYSVAASNDVIPMPQDYRDYAEQAYAAATGPFLGYHQPPVHRRAFSVPNVYHQPEITLQRGGDEEAEMRRQAARSQQHDLLFLEAATTSSTAPPPGDSPAASAALATLPAGPVEDGGELDEINRLLASAIPPSN